jgi:hypothetical protein
MAFLTELTGRGGAVALHASNVAKKVKALFENILWNTDRHDGAVVKYLTVYTLPNETVMAEITLRQLKWVLTIIFFIDA